MHVGVILASLRREVVGQVPPCDYVGTHPVLLSMEDTASVIALGPKAQLKCQDIGAAGLNGGRSETVLTSAFR
jgi:hypothetical protein